MLRAAAHAAHHIKVLRAKSGEVAALCRRCWCAGHARIAAAAVHTRGQGNGTYQGQCHFQESHIVFILLVQLQCAEPLLGFGLHPGYGAVMDDVLMRQFDGHLSFLGPRCWGQRPVLIAVRSGRARRMTPGS